MSKKQNLRKSLIYYLLIPLSLSFLVSLSVFLLKEFNFVFIDDVIFNPGNHSVNPAIAIGIASFMLLAGIFGRFDYKLRQLFNLDIKIDEEYIRELLEEKYQPILDGKIQEQDICHKIPILDIKTYFKKPIELIKKRYDVSNLTYYKKNPKYNFLFSPGVSLYKYTISGKYFVVFKVKNKYFDEIILSKNELIFVNNKYKGEKIFLEYSDEKKKFLHPKNIEGHIAKQRSIDLYKKIKNNKKLFDKIHRTMRKTQVMFHFFTTKKQLNFQDIRYIINQYKNNLEKMEEDFYLNEKEACVVLSYFSLFKLKVKPDFFDLADDLFGEIFS